MKLDKLFLLYNYTKYTKKYFYRIAMVARIYCKIPTITYIIYSIKQKYEMFVNLRGSFIWFGKNKRKKNQK